VVPRGGAAEIGAEMPLLSYFLFVGGTLLALLFVSDAVLPTQPLPSFLNVASSDQPLVRIRSDRKWPEPIAFDTNTPTVKPAIVAEAQPVPQVVTAPKVRVRDAFAQFTPPDSRSDVRADAKIDVKIDAQTGVKPDQAVAKAAEAPRPPLKRKVAKVRPSRPMMLVAQQPPHYGLFDSTW
jgi:hypothetical protein